MQNTTDTKYYLEQFPLASRSFVADLFYKAVRASATTGKPNVDLILSKVRDEIKNKPTNKSLPPLPAHRIAVLKQLLESLDSSQVNQARAYASYIINYEALPSPERHLIRSIKLAQRLIDQFDTPLTTSQTAYLQALNSISRGNKDGVSQLIDFLLPKLEKKSEAA